MEYSKYRPYFTKEYLMGPNSIHLADELLKTYPLKLNRQSKVLDLGCGTGLSSFYIAMETNAVVYANDLWITAEDNARRFKKWNLSEQILPFQEDANHLSFEKGFFDAVISIDAYHYFAGEKGFFAEKILPLVKSGGMVLIAVPGVKEAYEGRQYETLREWAKEEAHMFHSCSWWKDVIGEHPHIEFVETWELKSFTAAWNDWLEIDNPFAAGDRSFFSSIIKKYTNFVGIAVKKR